jgi:hypothetical protein
VSPSKKIPWRQEGHPAYKSLLRFRSTAHMSGTTGALSMTALRLEWTLKPMMMMTFYTIITSG